MTIIYHLARKLAWEVAQKNGTYNGTDEDRVDGFMHFSTANQVAVSAAKHRAGEKDLLLIAADSENLGDTLKWEISRDNALFPHLYGSLKLADVISATYLPLDENGLHIFPEMD